MNQTVSGYSVLHDTLFDSTVQVPTFVNSAYTINFFCVNLEFRVSNRTTQTTQTLDNQSKGTRIVF